MAGEIKRHVRFYIEQRKSKATGNKNQPKPLILSFHYDGKILCSTTGIKLKDSDWDKAKQRVKLSVLRSKEVNQIIDGIERKINDTYYSLLARNIPVNNALLISGIKTKKEVVKISFWNEWEKYFEMNKNRLSKGTLKSNWTSYNKFKEFIGKRDVQFDDITPELLSQYAEFLLKIGNTNNTIHGNIKRIKIFLNHSKKTGLLKNDSYKHFNVPERVGSIKFLEWKEVKLLLDMQLTDALERDVRDLFCMCCLTALRFSDVLQLRKTDIQEYTFENIEEVHLGLNIRQQKTDKVTVIPLLKEAIEIIDRNKHPKRELIMPQRALQTVNRVIKQLGKQAGIKSQQSIVIFRGNQKETKTVEKHEVLATHMGRRTFVTIAATRKIPISVIASITGQNPKTTLKHYMGVVEVEKFREVSKMNF